MRREGDEQSVTAEDIKRFELVDKKEVKTCSDHLRLQPDAMFIGCVQGPHPLERSQEPRPARHIQPR